MVAVISLATVLVSVGLLCLALRSGGIRRREFRTMRSERDLAVAALDEIERETDTYLELESVLAPAVRGVIRRNRQERAQLR